MCTHGEIRITYAIATSDYERQTGIIFVASSKRNGCAYEGQGDITILIMIFWSDILTIFVLTSTYRLLGVFPQKEDYPPKMDTAKIYICHC